MTKRAHILKKQKSSLQSVNQQLHPATKGNLTLVREPGALQLAQAATSAACSYNTGTVLWAAACEGASRASGFSLLQWRPAKDKRGVLLHGFLNPFGYCQPSVSRFSPDGGRHSAARVSQRLPPRRPALRSIGFIHWYFLPKASEVLTAHLMKSCGRIGLTNTRDQILSPALLYRRGQPRSKAQQPPLATGRDKRPHTKRVNSLLIPWCTRKLFQH